MVVIIATIFAYIKRNQSMKNSYFTIVFLMLLSACVSKKEILYLQNVDDYNGSVISYQEIKIQPNDILNIKVGALIPETAIPYNQPTASGNAQNNTDALKLTGYLVSKNKTITFPILGIISVEDKTTAELEDYLVKQLKDGGHMVDPIVTVRIVNAKVTILGEVNSPGTYTFDEESITVLQALGYAGDITIRGVREDVLIMREIDGVRKISHIDLTSADWLNGPDNFVKPNDVIVVNQNGPEVMSAGYIPTLGAWIGTASLILTLTLILTN